MNNKDPCSHLYAIDKVEDYSENCTENKKLSKPTLNSTIRRKNEIELIQNMKLGNPSKNGENLFNKTKITTKLNFGAHQKVFNNLTPINVNDSLLPKEKLPIPKKYKLNSDKIPPPDLHDFIDKIPPLLHVIDEPEVKLEIMEYDFDIMSTCKIFNT